MNANVDQVLIPGSVTLNENEIWECKDLNRHSLEGFTLGIHYVHCAAVLPAPCQKSERFLLCWVCVYVPPTKLS